MADEILIRGLQLPTRIGVTREERAEEQILRGHLTLRTAEFSEDDDLEKTVDYQKVAEVVRELALKKERRLIETLATEIAGFLLRNYPLDSVRVEIEKKILPETDWVGVSIERERN